MALFRRNNNLDKMIEKAIKEIDVMYGERLTTEDIEFQTIDIKKIVEQLPFKKPSQETIKYILLLYEICDNESEKVITHIQDFIGHIDRDELESGKINQDDWEVAFKKYAEYLLLKDAFYKNGYRTTTERILAADRKKITELKEKLNSNDINVSKEQLDLFRITFGSIEDMEEFVDHFIDDKERRKKYPKSPTDYFLNIARKRGSTYINEKNNEDDSRHKDEKQDDMEQMLRYINGIRGKFSNFSPLEVAMICMMNYVRVPEENFQMPNDIKSMKQIEMQYKHMKPKSLFENYAIALDTLGKGKWVPGLKPEEVKDFIRYLNYIKEKNRKEKNRKGAIDMLYEYRKITGNISSPKFKKKGTTTYPDIFISFEARTKNNKAPIVNTVQPTSLEKESNVVPFRKKTGQNLPGAPDVPGE